MRASIFGAAKLESGSAQRLAHALHHHRVAVLVIDESVRPGELEQFLRFLTVDRQSAESPPIWDRLVEAGVRGIAVEPVDYQSVVMTDEAALSRGQPRVSIWETITRQLLAGRHLLPFQEERALPELESAEDAARWIESLLREEGAGGGGGGAGGGVGPGGGGAGGQGGPGAAGGVPGSAAGGAPGTAAQGAGPGGGGAGAGPAAGGAGAGPGAGPGVGGAGAGPGGGAGVAGAAGPGRAGALAIALGDAVSTHLGGLGGADCQAAARQVLDLARRLPVAIRPTVLQASLRALATRDETADALRTLTAGAPPASVLGALRHLSRQKVQLSPAAVRLARELTAAARAQQEASAPVDPTFAGTMRELFRDVDVDRVPASAPVDDDSRGVVEIPVVRPLEAGEPPELSTWRDTHDEDFLDRQLTYTLIELVAVDVPQRAPAEPTLWRLEDLYRGFLLGGRVAQATEVVEALSALHQQARAGGGPDAELRRCLERLANRDAVGALLQALPQLDSDGTASARRLVAILGRVAVRHLVAALSESTDRSRRHQLMELLSSLGAAVVPDATLLLGDGRWFVVRNMILLLRAVGDTTSLQPLRRCAAHADLRVRLEAIKSLFAIDSEVPTDLLSKALNDHNPKVAEAAIALAGSYGIAEAVDPLVEMLRRSDLFGRRRSVRLLALKALGRLAEPSALPRLERFFKERRLLTLVAREERVAAFATLGSYPAEARAAIVARGLRARDPEIRAVCERLGAGTVASSADDADV